MLKDSFFDQKEKREKKKREEEEKEKEQNNNPQKILSLFSLVIFLLSLSILIFVCWFEFRKERKEREREFFLVSDFHFDPLANPQLFNSSSSCRNESMFQLKLKDMTKEEVESQKRGAEIQTSLLRRREIQQDSGMYGRFGCDSPLSLINATLQEMKRVCSTPDWIFITGDLAAHGLPDRAPALQTTTKMMKETFPDVPLYFCFGNNDVAVTNSHMDCSSEWIEFAYGLWEEYIPKDQKKTFLQMGAYRVNMSHSSSSSSSETRNPFLRLLVLNTMFYSVVSNHHDEEDPCGQFEWMVNELQEARAVSAKIYLMSHIMPGMDSKRFIPYWNLQHNNRYFDIIEEYSDVIIGQLYGHTHNDEFRVYGESVPGEELFRRQKQQQQRQRQRGRQQQQKEEQERVKRSEKEEIMQGLVNPAISPIYGNNPAFRLTYYNPETFAISDYRIHYMDLLASNEQETPIWNFLYSFNSYHVGEPDKEGLSLLYKKLFESEKDFDTWYSYRGA